jgi:Ca2+:H+ antiporter
VTAINVSVKDQLTLSSAVAIGSTIVSGRFFGSCGSTLTLEQQLSLFVIPLICIIAWITGYPLGMLFDPFESVALYLASRYSFTVQQSAIDSLLLPLFCASSSEWYR